MNIEKLQAMLAAKKQANKDTQKTINKASTKESPQDSPKDSKPQTWDIILVEEYAEVIDQLEKQTKHVIGENDALHDGLNKAREENKKYKNDHSELLQKYNKAKKDIMLLKAQASEKDQEVKQMKNQQIQSLKENSESKIVNDMLNFRIGELKKEIEYLKNCLQAYKMDVKDYKKLQKLKKETTQSNTAMKQGKELLDLQENLKQQQSDHQQLQQKNCQHKCCISKLEEQVDQLNQIINTHREDKLRLEEQILKLQESSTLKISQIKQDHEEEIFQIKDDNDNQIFELKNDFDHEIQWLKNDNEALKSKFKKEINEFKIMNEVLMKEQDKIKSQSENQELELKTMLSDIQSSRDELVQSVNKLQEDQSQDPFQKMNSQLMYIARQGLLYNSMKTPTVNIPQMIGHTLLRANTQMTVQ